MSHELRTPLAVIDSGAQIIERKAGTLGPDDLRRRSERLRGAVRRIGELVDKLVLSLGTGRARPALAPVTLAVLEAVERAAKGFDPARIVRGRTEPVTALADPEALGTALHAVLDNALRYSGKDGIATIEITREGDNAVIVVTDNGPTLEEAALGRIGQLFHRGENAAGSAGAGVSLHLARRGLAETGGAIDIARGEHGGLCVRIILPLAGEAQ